MATIRKRFLIERLIERLFCCFRAKGRGGEGNLYGFQKVDLLLECSRSVALICLVPFHTPPEEFKNRGFTSKTHQMFSFHTTPQNFKNVTTTCHFEFVFEKNSVKETI